MFRHRKISSGLSNQSQFYLKQIFFLSKIVKVFITKLLIWLQSMFYENEYLDENQICELSDFFFWLYSTDNFVWNKVKDT